MWIIKEVRNYTYPVVSEEIRYFGLCERGSRIRKPYYKPENPVPFKQLKSAEKALKKLQGKPYSSAYSNSFEICVVNEF